jgi:hypothetical protein
MEKNPVINMNEGMKKRVNNIPTAPGNISAHVINRTTTTNIFLTEYKIIS